ncbi:MAG TPA: phosphoribosylformylglycinamidine synthase subunit PurS, partial [Thermoanaerobaculia bacterium]|nr:phosphoribosylformylglycinamidine synthase subunit PurS [Thermoanaerobaculia bacterium]
MKARVLVYPRREVLDPQGRAIQQALTRLGFQVVSDVRAGKSFEIELAAKGDEGRRQVEAMCQQLLANPIVESWEVEVPGAAARGGKGGGKGGSDWTAAPAPAAAEGEPARRDVSAAAAAVGEPTGPRAAAAPPVVASAGA